MTDLKKVASSFRTFDECFDDLINLGIETCEFCLDSDGVWKRISLVWMLEYFKENEKYEKCYYLHNLIKTSLIADEATQERLNQQLRQKCLS